MAKAIESDAPSPPTTAQQRREAHILAAILKEYPLPQLVGKEAYFTNGAQRYRGIFKCLENGKMLFEAEVTHLVLSAWPSSVDFWDISGFKHTLRRFTLN